MHSASGRGVFIGTATYLTRMVKEVGDVLWISSVPVTKAPGVNFIPGQSHVIKTVEVVIAETALGRGILGAIDGERPRGMEGAREVSTRQEFLCRFGYKRG